jgi:GTP-binding protein
LSPDSSGGFDAREIEAGRLLFSRPVTFLLGAAKLEQLPEGSRCEIAFAGRSNSGKSSLLNALCGRGGLARASNAPGRTRELNCFQADGGLIIVDLPGYGYARADKRTKTGWQRLVTQYLATRRDLKRVFLLIDARRGVMETDRELMDVLDASGITYQLVVTKSDKLSATELQGQIEGVREFVARRPAAHPFVHATSSITGLGLAELRAEIATLAG